MSATDAIAIKKTFEKVDFFMIGTLPTTNFEIGRTKLRPGSFSIINLRLD